MNLNHNVQTSSKETFLNGFISDFTDCVDFTKHYQRSCGFEEEGEEEEAEDFKGASDMQVSVCNQKADFTNESSEHLEQKQDNNISKFGSDDCPALPSNEHHSSTVKIKNGATVDLETHYHPIEPDVSITIEESNLEKPNSHSEVKANAEKFKEQTLNSNSSRIYKKKYNKQKLLKKNHLKLPGNNNLKKKVSLFKVKNGKYLKKRSESFKFQGIQSDIKFKCYKCSYSNFSTIAELQTHQRKCLSGTPDFSPINEASSLANSSSSNFRITRKVYLCSACGSYYENWNLFLHMREMHKRHICLYCLGMFSQSDKLAQHLQVKHNVIEQTLSSSEEFFQLYRGNCYLICIICEAMFSDQEELLGHSCVTLAEESCEFCGLRGAHFPSCRRAFSDRQVVEPTSQKSHPAFGKKLGSKKKKMKNNKKIKEVFQIVSSEKNRGTSVIVRKQNVYHTPEIFMDAKTKDVSPMHQDGADNSVLFSLTNSNDESVCTKQYNEKMLQLYKPGKTSEKVISSIQSIEDSINRVVENLRMSENCEPEYECERNINDTSIGHADQGKQSPPEKEDFHAIPYERVQDLTSRSEERAEEKEDAESEKKANVLQEINSLEASTDGDLLPKPMETPIFSESESTDSEKLTIALDHPSERRSEKGEEVFSKDFSMPAKSEDNIPTTSSDTSYIFVSLKNETSDLKYLIKEFVKVSCWNCVYCSHAKRIALNGKQLALHILAEHRFVTVNEEASDYEKEQSALEVIDRLKSNLNTLENSYFNTDTFDSDDKGSWKINDKIYECFHCLFATYVHKELCSHNRKMHQKAMFLCIMCKSNFYTYSELLCHLCPGVYVSGQVINPDIMYRCFLCNVEPLPSSFRLMVHLRRKHNSCDICFDQSSNQFQLSTHVWKHKLSHMCYRCGIAYRNKPDITKHLFWKHGTESVLCKKCLQKKWPHVYHFCVPPSSFICDECSVSLKSAVALKVHKRLHSRDYPYSCDKCEKKFVSRKLLNKHVLRHEETADDFLQEKEVRTPANDANLSNNTIIVNEGQIEEVKRGEDETAINGDKEAEKKSEREKKGKKKRVINDVFDLPPVNLSESDDSDQEETRLPKIYKSESPLEELSSIPNGCIAGVTQKDDPSPTQIVDGVWNNFQNYLVAKDMPKTFRPPSPFRNMTLSRIKEIMLSDHDYHIVPDPGSPGRGNPLKTESEKPSTENKKKVGFDHDYCNSAQKGKNSCKSKQKAKHREDASKSSSSDSSSDSESSCSCGSNCSCSSSSSSSSSSNDSDSDSREKRKQKKTAGKFDAAKGGGKTEASAEVDISVHDVSNESLIRESDLETSETETDEDFYDYNPAREANRILAEKRTQLLANLNGSESVASTPKSGSEKSAPSKEKGSKFKKKKSMSRANAPARTNQKKGGSFMGPVKKIRGHQVFGEDARSESHRNTSYESAPSNLRNEPASEPGERNARRPKRKRIPLKFYGFSSEEENEGSTVSKKREKIEGGGPGAPALSSHAAASSSTPEASDKGASAALWSPHSKNPMFWKVEKANASTPKVNPIKIRTSQGGGAKPPSAAENSVEGGEALPSKKSERNFQVMNGNPVAQKGEKLYCFCQCPYDEVSEMIACDAEECLIEWFHFECVGIMVPPKGSWYCPDCRKKLAAENEFMVSSGENDPAVV